MKRNSINLLLASAAVCTLAACAGGSKGGSTGSSGKNNSGGVGTASLQALTPEQKAACTLQLANYQTAQAQVVGTPKEITLKSISANVVTKCDGSEQGENIVLRQPEKWETLNLNFENGKPAYIKADAVELFNADTCERFGTSVDAVNIAGIQEWFNSSPIFAYSTFGTAKALFSLTESKGITLKEGANKIYFRYYQNCLPAGDYKNAPASLICDNPGEVVKTGFVVINVQHEKVERPNAVYRCQLPSMAGGLATDLPEVKK